MDHVVTHGLILTEAGREVQPNLYSCNTNSDILITEQEKTNVIPCLQWNQHNVVYYVDYSSTVWYLFIAFYVQNNTLYADVLSFFAGLSCGGVLWFAVVFYFCCCVLLQQIRKLLIKCNNNNTCIRTCKKNLFKHLIGC